jgi:hypothetical protein
LTGFVAGWPAATTRVAMSRSVMTPTTCFISSQTGRKPTSRSRMSRAASWTAASGVTDATFFTMMS